MKTQYSEKATVQCLDIEIGTLVHKIFTGRWSGWQRSLKMLSLKIFAEQALQFYVDGEPTCVNEMPEY